MLSLSPLPQNWAANIEQPEAKAIQNMLNTNATWDASDTADIASWSATSMTVSASGTSENMKFCSVIGRIRDTSFLRKELFSEITIRVFYHKGVFVLSYQLFSYDISV